MDMAVSDIIRGHPEWTDRGLEWLEAFDTIDLFQLLEVARANRASVPRGGKHCRRHL
jgi:hypothetical protein